MLLHRLTHRQDSTGIQESNSDSSDYESAGEDLCSPSGEHSEDAPHITPPEPEPTCSYGRLGILSHVAKSLRKADSNGAAITAQPPTLVDLPPQPPDATVRWEHPATGKVHILDKVCVCKVLLANHPSPTLSAHSATW